MRPTSEAERSGNDQKQVFRDRLENIWFRSKQDCTQLSRMAKQSEGRLQESLEQLAELEGWIAGKIEKVLGQGR